MSDRSVDLLIMRKLDLPACDSEEARLVDLLSIIIMVDSANGD